MKEVTSLAAAANEAARDRRPTRVEQLARFACRSSWDDISESAREQLKLRVLDSLGVAFGALDGEPVAMVREQVQEFGGAPLATLIGSGKSAPDRTALYNGALVRYLRDVLETMGEHVDALKFAGGSFTLMPERALREIIEIAHEHDVLVSTGGFIEHVLTQGRDAVQRYIDEVARVGFDILDVSAGFISIPTDDILRLVERVQRAGLKAKPKVGIQFGAGGATTPEELEQEGTRDVGFAIDLARRYLDAGAYMVMIESEGITEEVSTWRTDVVPTITRELGLEKVMFEATDPEVFGWYVKNYGPEVNLFVDHSQIVQLDCLRRGIWGSKSLWGRVVTYPGA